MTPNSDLAGSAIDRAFRSLQDQRTACVARLTAVLKRDGGGSEVEAYLARIDTINAAMIRLASAQMRH
ncbi:MAG: hypothetical protein AB7E81_00535 [Hyphomicrobiaceae bacterium]